jgi:hypothetical protein
MKSNLSRILSSLLVAVVFCPGASFADKKNNKKVVPLTRKGAASELSTIKRVNGDKVTIGKKTYQVNDLTKVTVNGESAKVGDLSSGMQVSVTGSVLRYGKGKSDTLYKATRISAKADNNLEKKRKEFNKKQAERARQLNRKNNRNRNR